MVVAECEHAKYWLDPAPDSAAPELAPLLVLAHGAGAPADSAWMAAMAGALAACGVSVARFEFPYMTKRREDGRKRPPDRMPALVARYREVLADFSGRHGGALYIGGKSMGGRVASMLAADPATKVAAPGLSGVVCFGYPFHPPGRPERLRTEHFRDLQVPQLIVQGPRDPFGRRDEMPHLLPADGPPHESAPGSVHLHWLTDGDHDFRPLKRSGLAPEDSLAEAVAAAARFMGVAHVRR